MAVFLGMTWRIESGLRYVDGMLWLGIAGYSFVHLENVRDRGTQVLTKISHPSCSLEKMGALDWAKVVHQHQGWRLISCIWLHAGLIHLVINMLSLLFIGIRLEQQFGFGKFHTST